MFLGFTCKPFSPQKYFSMHMKIFLVPYKSKKNPHTNLKGSQMCYGAEPNSGARGLPSCDWLKRRETSDWLQIIPC